MSDASVSQVAAVLLHESGPESPAFRHVADRPLEGYGMVSGGENDACRVTLFVRNARMPAVYHGWAAGKAEPLYLGAFHMGSGGEGSLSVELSCATLESTHAILVSAGGVLLAGHLVWLVRPAPQPAPPPPPKAVEQPPVAVAPPPVAVEPSPEPAVTTAPVPAPQQPDPLAASPSEVTVEQAAPPEPPLLVETAPDEAGHPEPVIPGFKLRPKPALPAVAKVPLLSTHPQAARGAGLAVVDPESGALTLTLRGLPSPARLGTDPATGRSYNTYRAWLRHRRTQKRHPVGVCERTWGDNFSLQIEQGLILADYDQIVITAEDKTATHPNLQAPAVLTGPL